MAVQSSLQERLTGRLGDIFGLSQSADEFALARSDRKVLGGRLLRTLASERLLRPDDVYRVVPRRTWVRRKSEGDLSPAEFDGLYRLVRLQLLAELVFGDKERAHEWLHTPKKRLDDVAPIELATDTLGFEAVEHWLHEIDQGYFA